MIVRIVSCSNRSRGYSTHSDLPEPAPGDSQPQMEESTEPQVTLNRIPTCVAGAEVHQLAQPHARLCGQGHTLQRTLHLQG